MKITLTNDTKAGTYTLASALVTLDADTAAGTYTLDDFVPPVPLVLQFTATVAAGYVVTVKDTSTGTLPTDEMVFAWSNGKPTACSIGGSVSHTYPNGSQYMVTQTVTRAGTSVIYKHPVYPGTITPPAGTTPTPPSSPPPPPPPPPPVDPTPPGTPNIRTAVATVGRRVILSCWAVPNGSPVAGVSIDWADGNPAQSLNLVYEATKHDYPDDGDYAITISASSQSGEVAMVTIPVTLAQLAEPPEPRVTSDGEANLTATLAGGIAVDVTVNKGERVPLIASNPSLGSIVFHGDGLSVCVEDMYETCTYDLAGHFKLNASGKTLWNDLEVIWAHARTRPFWVAQPVTKPSPDLSKFGKWGTAGSGASLLKQYLAADNGPMGVSFQPPGIGSGGEREELGGPLQEADAIYVVNPSADNEIVVYGLSDAFAPQPCGVIDSQTNKMLDVTQYPNATFDTGIVLKNNPIVAYTSNTPLSLSQAWTHATPACALAAELRGTDYDKEQLALWANYVGSLWQNPGYRLSAGCIGSGGAARGKARTLTVVMYAAILSDNQPYFMKWMEALAVEFNAVFPSQTGIQIDQRAASSEGYQGGSAAFANWQQLMFVHSLGQSINNGFIKFQPTLDYFAQFAFDSILVGPHELTTIYNINWKDASGNIATDWAQAIQFTGVANPKVAAALKCAEGSAELQAALGYASHQPGDFAASDPTSDSNYIAQAQGAYAVLSDLATDQASAQSAWSKFMQYNRVDYSKNPKYDLVPRTPAA